MKFLVTKELSKSPFLRYLMGTLTLFILIFLVTDIMLHHYQIGLTLETVTATLFGNEEAFIEPILLPALLLQVHIDLFLSMFILLILAAMYIRLYEKCERAYIWIHMLFLSGLVAPLLLLGNYFISQSMGIVVWIAIFYLWHGVAFLLSLKVLWRLK